MTTPHPSRFACHLPLEGKAEKKADSRPYTGEAVRRAEVVAPYGGEAARAADSQPYTGEAVRRAEVVAPYGGEAAGKRRKGERIATSLRASQ